MIAVLNQQRVKNRRAPCRLSSRAVRCASLQLRNFGRDESLARKAEWSMTDYRVVALNRLRRSSPTRTRDARWQSPSGPPRLPTAPARHFARRVGALTLTRIQFSSSSRHARAKSFAYSTKGFHQFSRNFTSLWAAVEVNAVQTTCHA